MQIFHISKDFSNQEKYSLTSQVVRSSGSISANIVEGWTKREYENYFKQHLVHALGSNSETQNWIKFARDCNDLYQDKYKKLDEELNVIGKMLTKLHRNWKSF